LADLEFYHIERLLSRNPPFGQNLTNKLQHFPRLKLGISIIGHDVGEPRNCIVRATLACLNPKTSPVWRGAVPWVTFLLEKQNGSIGFFWRGSIKTLATDLGKDLTFRVDLGGQGANAYLACEEIVGTMVKKDLPS